MGEIVVTSTIWVQVLQRNNIRIRKATAGTVFHLLQITVIMEINLDIHEGANAK